MASELCESGQRGDVIMCVSREGGVQNVSGYFVQAGTIAIGDGDSGCGIAGTVAIGDQDNGGVYSWDSAEGRDSKLERYDFIGGGCCGLAS